MAYQPLQGETAIEYRHHHPTRPGVEAASTTSRSPPRMPAPVMESPLTRKNAGGMADQLVIEIDSHLHVIVRGRGKASGDAFDGQGQVGGWRLKRRGWATGRRAIGCHGDVAGVSLD